MSTSRESADLIAPLSLPGGGFAMVALDQRESLRDMFIATGSGGPVEDDVLRAFKMEAVDVLSPYASGMLLDRPLALSGGRPQELAPGCGLIVAADVLVQQSGGPVETTELDPVVTPEYIAELGAVAIKLLVIWRAGDDADERAELVSSFIRVAEEAGVASLVEGIVRPDSGNWTDQAARHETIISAARDLCSFEPTIYKAEVPGYVQGDLSRVAEESKKMTDVVGRPWVVLSNGVRQPDFADAVRSACSGGAHGFLAGRAIWSDIVGEKESRLALVDRSVPRLENLTGIVEDAMSTYAGARKGEG
jgi:sulfofructosephosphate aldolase